MRNPAYKLQEEYQSIVSQLEVRLASNDRSENKLEQTYRLQDRLAFISIQAYKNPNFFTEGIINSIYDLLKQAGN
jgi:hypothetical protein